LEQYQRALTIREVEAPNSLDVAGSYNNFGLVLKDKGYLDGALEQYQRALAIKDVKAPNSLDVAASSNNIGMFLRNKGDLDGTLEQFNTNARWRFKW
jgi:tetratricopeptide (TPR) repeat protein